jgi:hypothetical protein
MFTNRFFTVLAILVLVAVLVLTVQEAIATSAVTSNEHVADSMERSREADTARWQAMADYYQKGNVQPMDRSRAADAARWEAMAEYYQMQAEAPNLQRGRAADAARWTAMAEYYLQISSTTH